jgi:cell division protein FtsB
MRRAAWPLTASVVLVGLLFLFVFPTRTYVAQRRGMDGAHQRVKVLSEQNRELAARVKRLNTDTEIERLAREQYNLVRPGEDAYAILPAPRPVTPTPQPAKATAKPKKSRGVVATVLDRLAFWS